MERTDLMDQEPLRQVRAAAGVMLAVLPLGVIITAGTFVAIARQRNFVARQEIPRYQANSPNHLPRAADEAMLRSAERDAWSHALWIMLFFGCAAAVFGGLAWWLRHDRRRRAH